jgi:hypothetical protein
MVDIMESNIASFLTYKKTRRISINTVNLITIISRTVEAYSSCSFCSKINSTTPRMTEDVSVGNLQKRNRAFMKKKSTLKCEYQIGIKVLLNSYH